MTVAAIGPGTARALRAHGVEADIVPERAVAEGLVEALRGRAACERVLVARAAEGRDVLIDALRERGAHVDVVALYETLAEPLDDATREAAAAPTTSSSRPGPRCASSPPRGFARRTAAGVDRAGDQRRAAEHGAEPDLEADPHTPDGLVAALLADAVTSAA